MRDSKPTLTQWCQSFRPKSSIPSPWLSTRWTGEASFRTWWEDRASMGWGNPRSAEMFECVHPLRPSFQAFIHFLLEIKTALFPHVHCAGFDKSVSAIFKTNSSQSGCWPAKTSLHAAVVQGSCLPAGLEHLSSHSSVPDYEAQFAYVATSLWEYVPLNT